MFTQNTRAQKYIDLKVCINNFKNFIVILSILSKVCALWYHEQIIKFLWYTKKIISFHMKWLNAWNVEQFWYLRALKKPYYDLFVDAFIASFVL